MQCSRCGTRSFDGSLYCGNCGARFDEAPGALLTPADQPGAGNEETQFASAQIGLPPEPVSQTIGVEPAPVAAPPATIEPAPVPPGQPVYPQPFAPVPPGQPVYPQPFAPVPPGQPVYPQPFAPPAQMTPGISGTSGWIEFGAVPTPGQTMSSGIYPPPALPPGYPAPYSYPGAPASAFPQSGVQPPYMPLPPAPVAPPRRKWPVFISGLGVGVLLALILGGVIIGLRANPSPNTTAVATALPTTVITPAATPVDGNLLYQQVTSQAPAIVDSLKDTTSKSWSFNEHPLSGCEIKSDGFHVHIKDLSHFYYCSYRDSVFTNFAMQVEMQILTGNGGGFTFRGNSLSGDYYYFHVFPDGGYNLYLSQNHKLTTRLATGYIDSFSASGKTTLAVIAKSGQIYLYSNGRLFTTTWDATYAGGYVGLLAEASNTPSEVVYTNAQFWIL